MNKIISLIGFGPNPGKTFFLIDGKFLDWEEGLAYIKQKLGTTNEAKVTDFILSLPEEKRLWARDGRSKSVEEWLKEAEAEYRQKHAA